MMNILLSARPALAFRMIGRQITRSRVNRHCSDIETLRSKSEHENILGEIPSVQDKTKKT